MESKAEAVNLSLVESETESSTPTTNELGALTMQNVPQPNDHADSDVNILNSKADIVINEIHANEKGGEIIKDKDTSEEFEEELDKNAAIPTQQRYDDEEPSLMQKIQKGPFKSVQARTYTVATALIFYCVLKEWFWDSQIKDAKLLIDLCDGVGNDWPCNVACHKIRDGAFTIFFGIFAMFPGILCSFVSAAKGGHKKLGMYSLAANVIGTILIFCGYFVYVAGWKFEDTVDQSRMAELFGELAIVCGCAIIMSLDNIDLGLDDIKTRSLFMSSIFFAIFGFIIFVGRGIIADKTIHDDAPSKSEAAVAAGFFIVSITSMIRIGIVFGQLHYSGSDSLISKLVALLMGIGGIILVSGYWGLASNEHDLYNDKGEEAGIIGNSFFFGIMVAANALDMGFGKIVREVRSGI